MLSISQTIVW